MSTELTIITKLLADFEKSPGMALLDEQKRAAIIVEIQNGNEEVIGKMRKILNDENEPLPEITDDETQDLVQQTVKRHLLKRREESARKQDTQLLKQFIHKIKYEK